MDKSSSRDLRSSVL